MSVHPPVPDSSAAGAAELLLHARMQPDEENPWIGLFSFTEDIRTYFHGRAGESETLARMIARKTLTVLYGESGLGKSSLLQAGVFPLLRNEGFLPVYIRLNCTVQSEAAAEAKVTIGQAIARAIARGEVVSRRLSPEALAPQPEETFWDYLHRFGEADLCLASPDDGVPGRPLELVLAFDQFEEIFTLGQLGRRGQRRGPVFTLLQDLADCVENRLPAHVKRQFDAPNGTGNGEMPSEAPGHRRHHYRIIFSLRKDFVAELDDLRDLMPSIMENRMLLRSLDGRQALDAVLMPGRKLVTPYVARRIVRFVSAMKRSGPISGACEDDESAEERQLSELLVDPSLLSMVCRELNKKRLQIPGQATITSELVEHGSRTILEDFYEECFSDQPEPPVRRFVEDCLLNENDRRRQMDLSQAESQLAADGVQAPAAALERLVQHRLLRVIEGPDRRSAQLELAHDVLCQVVSAKRLEREARLAQERDAAKRLAEAREREKQLLAETERQREEAAKATERFQRLRRQRVRGIIFTAVLMMASLAMAYALYKGYEAQKELENRKRTDSGKNYVYAKRYADRASERDQVTADALPESASLSLEPRDNILALTHDARAMIDNPGNTEATALACRLLLARTWCPPLAPLAVKDPEDKMLAVTPTPDGQIVAVSQNGKLLRWKSDEKNVAQPEVQELQGDGLQSAVFSPNGHWLLTGTRGREEAQLWVWDDSHHGYLRDASGGLEQVGTGDFRSVAWSPDGQWMAVLPNAGSGQFRLLQRKEQGGKYEDVTSVLHQPNERVMSLDISSDGQRIVTGSFDGKVRIWQTAHLAADALELVPTRSQGRTASNDRVFFTAFSPDPEGRWIAAVYADGPVRVWDMRSGGSRSVRLPISFGRDGCTRVTFSPDGRSLLETTIHGMGTAQIWDFESQRPVCEPMCHESMVFYAGFSADGKQIVSASGTTFGKIDTVRAWDATLLPPVPEAQIAPFDRVSADAPDWLPQLAEAVGGIEVGVTGYGYGPHTLAQVAQHISVSEAQGPFGALLRRFHLQPGGGGR